MNKSVDKIRNIWYYKDNKRTEQYRTEDTKDPHKEIPIVKGISKNLSKGGTDHRSS